MRNLFCTADRIGAETGGGIVTRKELDALIEFSQEGVQVVDQLLLANPNYRLPNSPYVQDYIADSWLLSLLAQPIHLSHFYSGMFGKTIWRLKNAGVKVTQTIAAHDVNLSMEEFAKYGIPFDFPHLTIRDLWLTYIEGQVMADQVICPSPQSAEIVKRYGVRGPIVIPHGIRVHPESPAPLPKKFTVGYLGQCGPDKGLRYLLEAWSKLNLKDAQLLMAGRGIEQMAPVWQAAGGRGEVQFLGWVDDPRKFYERLSVYVQPSVTEGFGIEVLEAMERGRPVIVSDGAGASSVVAELTDGYVFAKRDVDALCNQLLLLQHDPAMLENMGTSARMHAAQFSWDKILPLYQQVWKGLVP